MTRASYRRARRRFYRKSPPRGMKRAICLSLVCVCGPNLFIPVDWPNGDRFCGVDPAAVRYIVDRDLLFEDR